MIAILGCLLEVLAISEKYIKDGRFKKYTVAIFLGEDKGVQGAFERLSKLFVSEERLVVAILYANGQKTFEICRGIQETAERIESNTTGILDTVGQVQSSLGEVVAGLHQQRVVADVKEYLKTLAHDKSLEIYNEYDDIAQLKTGLRPGQ